MKFYCDNCGAKYSISDEKVRGKILKVRCKKCAYIITVREPREPAQASSSPAPPQAPGAAGPPSVPWHYSINGQSYGPYELEKLLEMYASGRIGDASYVWNETFTSWKPVYEVQEFADALEQSRQVRPRVETIGVGVTGQIEAIKPAQVERDPSHDDDEVVAGAVPGSFDAPSPEAKDSNLSDRLGKLRDRLKEQPQKPENPFAPPEPEAQESIPDTDLDDAAASTSSSGLAFDFTPEPDEPSEEPDFDLPPIATREGTQESEGEFRGVQSGQFPSLTRDMVQHDGDDPDVFTSSGMFDNIEALPDNEKSADFTPSASLLIELDSIQKEGRSRRVAFISASVVIVLFLGVTAGVLGWRASQRRATELANKPKVVQDDGPDELVITTYSQEELAQFLELEEEVLTPEELEANAADFRAEEKASKGSPEIAMRSTPKSDSPLFKLKSPIRSTDGTSLDDALRNAKSRENEGAKEGSAKSSVGSAKLGSPALDKGPKIVTGPKSSPKTRESSRPKIRGLGTPGKKGPGKIMQPTDTMGSRENTLDGKGLSKADARAGFKKIRKSLGYCHQRHVSRGLAVEPKISMTVEIQISGSVTSMNIEPRTMQNTELDRCMRSHMHRWRFAEFNGKPLKIKHTYVLQ